MATNKDIEARLLSIVREFLTELEKERAARGISLDASLERDLGIDSLAKVELFHRVEAKFSIQLPQRALIEAEKLKDLVDAIAIAAPPQQISATQFTPQLSAAATDPRSANTLIDALTLYAQQEPKRPHLYFQDEQGIEQVITYADLFTKACKIAKGLSDHGVKQGDTVAIMLPSGPEFFQSFCAIMLSGAIPVPIYPPFRPDRIEEYAKREAKILKNAEIRLLITFAKAEPLSKLLRAFIPSLQAVTTVKDLMPIWGKLTPVDLTTDDLALIQYTSGSTGAPKGVLLNHANILANIRAIGEAITLKPTDVMVSWLPLYHDMGLMSWLGSLYFGVPIAIMSPLSFLSRPERWLWAIHYHRGTLSAGPNFAYELCVKKIDPKRLEGLDLSCWRLAFNGAEAVNADTLRRFATTYAAYGFSPKAIFPVYGLAESTVALTFPRPQQGLQVDRVKKDVFAQQQIAEPTTDLKNYLEYVCCGAAIPGHAVRIVNDTGDVLPERQVGNLQFQGPASLQGYYRNPQATQAIFHAGWWDTGDLAYMVAGEIYVTGRKKDLMILAGRNIYPEEVESIVGEIGGVRKGCVAAFGVKDERRGTEKLIIVAETKITDVKANDRIRQLIIEKVAIGIGNPPTKIILTKPGTIPKTSSGKLQRSHCKQAYLAGQLTKKRLPISIQLVKLFVNSISRKLGEWITKLGSLFYTLYVCLMLLITVPPVWGCLFLFKPKTCRHIIKFWARSILRLIGCPLTVVGRAKMNAITPLIFVANHCSYTDIVVLLAVLPQNTAFVAKEELLRVPIITTFLKRLKVLTVNRLEFSKSLDDTLRIKTAVEQGRSIAVFPEGTFAYATGLRPFKSGAFKLAVDAQVPICPVALRGTRHLLRSGSLLFRPSRLKITFTDVLRPQAKDWQEMARLSNLARQQIAQYCGEPSLDLIVAGIMGTSKAVSADDHTSD